MMTEKEGWIGKKRYFLLGKSKVKNGKQYTYCIGDNKTRCVTFQEGETLKKALEKAVK